MSKLPGRIPFEDVEKFRNWAVPKVSGQVLASAEREARKAALANLPRQEHETVEEISAEQVSLGPMTAEQLAQITDEASREGFNQGYEEGLEKGLATGERQGLEQGRSQALAEWSGTLKAQVEKLAASCEALTAPMAQQQQRLTNEMLNLSVLLAEHLLQRELSQNPAAYWGWAHQALAQLPSNRPGASLFLPAEVVTLLREHQPPQLAQLNLVADTALELGAYRLEAGPSQVVFDARERLGRWLEEVQPNMELAPECKSFQPESIQTESVQTESVQTGSVQTESIQTESIQTESIQTESIQTESNEVDQIVSKSVAPGAEQTETPQAADVITIADLAEVAGPQLVAGEL